MVHDARGAGLWDLRASLNECGLDHRRMRLRLGLDSFRWDETYVYLIDHPLKHVFIPRALATWEMSREIMKITSWSKSCLLIAWVPNHVPVELLTMIWESKSATATLVCYQWPWELIRPSGALLGKRLILSWIPYVQKEDLIEIACVFGCIQLAPMMYSTHWEYIANWEWKGWNIY